MYSIKINPLIILSPILAILHHVSESQNMLVGASGEKEKRLSCLCSYKLHFNNILLIYQSTLHHIYIAVLYLYYITVYYVLSNTIGNCAMQYHNGRFASACNNANQSAMTRA